MVPFTIDSDIDLRGRAEKYLTSSNPDVTIRRGGVPHKLANAKRYDEWAEYADEKFLLDTNNGLRFYIEGGELIRYEYSEEESKRDVLLYLLGTVWGIVSYQRQLFPLHASGIMSGSGEIHAFSGESGAGKSTLTTAISARGHQFFSDDILTVDPAKIGKEPFCYAGQKDLKLWKDAIDLTKATGSELVSDDETYEKYYASPRQYSDLTVGKLKSLYMLSQSSLDDGDSDHFSIDRLTGGQAIRALSLATYLQGLGELIVGRKTIFEWMIKLSQNTEIYKFERPFQKNRFDEGLDLVTSHLTR